MAEAQWKRYFTPINKDSRHANAMSRQDLNSSTSFGGNFSSYLPEVYAGTPGRMERYSQYDQMDLDTHINACLDIIAEFCTQLDDDTGLPFKIFFKEPPTESQTLVLNKILKKWISQNRFDNRLFGMIRDVIQYGDKFFIRDPETDTWLPIYHANVESVLVNEAEGKEPEAYKVKGLDYNKPDLVATSVPGTWTGSYPTMPTKSYSQINYNNRQISSTGGSRFSKDQDVTLVAAKHVVHLSMNDGVQPNWPFGLSILEPIYKTFKQKELLEDSVLIYITQRAPERRIFTIPVGDMPEQKAMQFIERMKNEIHQRRIPNKTGGGNAVMDSSYHPLSILEDFFMPVKSDGVGPKVEVLPGGDTNWGLDALQYFDNKLARGLRVPSSYIPTRLDDSGVAFNDGKMGTALIQELRFAKYCERIQNTIVHIFDREFKLYLDHKGHNISAAIFDLRFVEPQNFGTWRKIEVDSAKIQNFTQMVGIDSISKRKAMKEYLQWSDSDILENMAMWAQENLDKFKNSTLTQKFGTTNNKSLDLNDVGFSPSDLVGHEAQQQFEQPSEEDIDHEDTQIQTPIEPSGPTLQPQTPINPA